MPEQEFLERLTAQGITCVADVRSLPGSRRSPQYDSDRMPHWLTEAGVGYVHLPELGGRRRAQPVDATVNAGWRDASFHNYADYGLGAAYRDGIRGLAELAGADRVVVMCGEPVPWRCHRLLIANTLAAQGWTVWHLYGAGAPHRHVLGQWGAAPVVDATGELTYPASATSGG